MKAFVRALNWVLKAPLIRWVRLVKVQLRYPDARIAPSVSWIYHDINTITLAPHVMIGPFSEIVVVSSLSQSLVKGRLTVEERVVIGSGANIRASGGEVFIGKDTLIAQHVSIVASAHVIDSGLPYRDQPWDETKTGVRIGSNVWIGTNSTILPGCHIGDNSIIGAGSVVTKSVPAKEIWAGVPAKKLRSLD